MTNVEIVGNIQETDELKMGLAKEIECIRGLTITTPEIYQSVAQGKLHVMATRKKIIEIFGPNEKKAYASWKEAKALTKSFTDLVDRYLAIADPKLVGWNQEQERKLAKAKADALEKQRKLDEAAEAKAKKLLKNGQPEKAEAVMSTIPQVPVAAPIPTKAPGLSFRDNWTAEFTNVSVFLNYAKRQKNFGDLVSPNQRYADGLAKITKGPSNMPGVKFVNSPIPIGRTR